MAHILYALNGQGLGHTSRALAVTHELRLRGHSVTFCCGGEAAERLERQLETVVRVPAPREIVRANQVRLLASAWHNLPLLLRLPDLIERLTEQIRSLAPDVVVSDFEPFAPRAARRLGIPAVALDRQHVLTETRYPVPLRYTASAALTRLGVHLMTPRYLFTRLLIPTFSSFQPRATSDAELLPPILRPDVRDAVPTDEEHVLVYVNHPAGSEPLLRTLGRSRADCFVYAIPPSAYDSPPSNLRFKPASRSGFIRDLATCRAVVCTAGFTLLSEALWLGKPVLALPNRGFFEQSVNALALERSGHGRAVFGPPAAHHLEALLHQPPPPRSGAPASSTLGNSLAVDRIEAICCNSYHTLTGPPKGANFAVSPA